MLNYIIQWKKECFWSRNTFSQKFVQKWTKFIFTVEHLKTQEIIKKHESHIMMKNKFHMLKFQLFSMTLYYYWFDYAKNIVLNFIFVNMSETVQMPTE